jgi:hypothetical protein
VKWDNLVVLPLAGFIQWPLAALVPAAILGALFVGRRRTVAAVAAVLWALYAVYELLMKQRVLCTGECNIRVDLLLILPALWILFVWALVSSLRNRGPRGTA